MRVIGWQHPEVVPLSISGPFATMACLPARADVIGAIEMTHIGLDESGLMLHREFGRWTFMHVGTIDPDRSPEGKVSEFMPQARYAKANTTRLNRHGDGPFCRVRVPGGPHRGGVYGMTADDNVMYIGEAQDMAQRWELSGYGSIQPKNCYVGDQSTNCKINGRMLKCRRGGDAALPRHGRLIGRARARAASGCSRRLDASVPS